MRAARRLVAALLAAALLVAACGDDDDTTSSTTTEVDDTTTTSSTSSTSSISTTTEPPRPSPPDTTGMDDEAQIRAVTDFVERLIFVTEDPHDPVLSQYLTGRALERISGVLRQAAAGGFSVRGSREVEITEVVMAPPIADVLACVASDLETVDSSGAVVETFERSVIVRFELVQENGQWKVEQTGDKDNEGETESCEVGT